MVGDLRKIGTEGFVEKFSSVIYKSWIFDSPFEKLVVTASVGWSVYSLIRLIGKVFF